MNLVNAEHLTHTYTGRLLFDDASFYLDENEKAGIIGINGTGKSTLLKIIAGITEPDQGSVTTAQNLRMAYLPQSPLFNEGLSVLDAALPLKNDISGEQSVFIPQAKSLLGKLGTRDLSQDIGTLSGGQRKRIALVRTLLTPADVLILDEPTNHLDGAMAEWLEEYLKNYRGALIIVTHDRYFLDSVTNRIVEIDKGKLYNYNCNYLGFIERKAEREEIERAAERKRQSILRTEIAWIKRGARARSTKQKAHIARYEALRDAKAPVTGATAQISSVSSRLGRTTIELKDINKSFNGNIVIKDFTYIFLRGSRIGITGANGCGKSTLMNIISGNLMPDSGDATIGQTVKISYFSQENETLDDSVRVIDYIREGGEVIKTNDGTVSASVMLERFLFPPEQQYSLIGRLSGGEKRRLYLLRILMEAPNVLLLDEPTNDLDITTLAILEDYLDTFDGIVIAISHDRYFLDRIATRILAFEGNGEIRQYEGGYTDYINASGRKLSVTDAGIDKKEDTKPQENTKTVNRNNWKDGQEKKKKMSYKEQREYETIEDDIAKLEGGLEDIEKEILKYSHDFVKLNELSAKKEEISNNLSGKMDRWLYLEELAQETGQ
ncbi:MAG: ABC-F family ATP-binding cassette domain-containing protein [Lachnospiraceae bacterium]|nr:ABC-F family ATP-binding cassette domain-containing protein [Lachnospiraceae bacterium]